MPLITNKDLLSMMFIWGVGETLKVITICFCFRHLSYFANQKDKLRRVPEMHSISNFYWKCNLLFSSKCSSNITWKLAILSEVVACLQWVLLQNKRFYYSNFINGNKVCAKNKWWKNQKKSTQNNFKWLGLIFFILILVL